MVLHYTYLQISNYYESVEMFIVINFGTSSCKILKIHYHVFFITVQILTKFIKLKIYKLLSC